MSRTASALRTFSMAVVLVVGCLYGTNTAAQGNGTCVTGTQQITYVCQSGCTKSGCTCKSTTTITVPTGQQYGSGVLYQTTTTQCCGNTISYLSSPDGQCSVHAPVRPPATAENHFVFVRGCDGRFRLYAFTG